MPVEASFADVLALLETVVAWFLGLLLAAAALHKLSARSRARRAAGDLLGLSWGGAGIAVGAAIAIETVAGVCLFGATLRGIGALLAAALWAVYLGLIGRALLAGRRDLDCGCSFGKAHRPLGSWQLLRAGCLALLAATVAGLAYAPALVGAASAAGLGVAECTSSALAALALLSLYGALDHVLALAPLRIGALR